MVDHCNYQELARTTAIYPNLGDNLVYTVLGLVGETSELLEKRFAERDPDVAKELSDVLWYLANCLSEIDESFRNAYVVALSRDGFAGYPYTWQSLLKYLVLYTGRVAGLTKKMIRDDDGRLTQDRKEKIQSEIVKATGTWIQMCRLLGYSPDKIMQLNIEKLFSRQERGVLQGDGDNR